MAEEIKTFEGPSDQSAIHDAIEREGSPAYFERGKEFIRRNKGRLALAAAGLITLGVAWKLGYIEDAVDAVKSAWRGSEPSSQSGVSISADAPAPGPAVTSPQPRAGSTPKAPFVVGSHVRNLHEGWKNSSKNRALAAEHGVALKPNQSYIHAYEKCRNAA